MEMGRHVYKAISHSVQVAVRPDYEPQRSKPEKGQHVWSYHIEICNFSQSDIQLRRRYWHIIDGLGRVQEVDGKGVVGEEPLIAAGDCYEYSSGCPLECDSGIMSGYFVMEGEDGEEFRVSVPAFSLDIPDETKVLN